MHPILFEIGGITIYSYGFMIALGVIAAVTYMVLQGKKDVGLTFDQANSLFLFIFISAFIGGKIFLIFEDPAHYLSNPTKLLAGSGFVFYGSFLFAVPTMLWYFKKEKLHTYKMLDVMAIVTCLVHMFGRLGCFLAGCCHGKPTTSSLGVTFTNPSCQAEPLNTPLYPTQLMEAGFILFVMIVLLVVKKNYQRFHGQLFLLYMLLYAIGRSVLEIFRGDIARGFIIKGYVSNSQFTALLIFIGVLLLYARWSKRNSIDGKRN
jgi:phosphatidylglycerol:prolipoprotein diacylglycerol transferase